jgi:hypothetical protein
LLIADLGLLIAKRAACGSEVRGQLVVDLIGQKEIDVDAERVDPQQPVLASWGRISIWRIVACALIHASLSRIR